MTSVTDMPKTFPHMVIKQATQDYSYDYNLRVHLYGDKGVGITCLLNRLIEDSYDEKYKLEIEACRIHRIDVNGKIVRLQLFDKRPSRYRTICHDYYPNILIYVFDSTDMHTLENVEEHLITSSKYAPETDY